MGVYQFITLCTGLICDLLCLGITRTEMWIGINDRSQEGKLEWRGTGRRVNPGTDFTNNLNGGGQADKDCVRIVKRTGLWGMRPCAKSNVNSYSICETDLL